MPKFSRAPIRAIRASDASIKGCEPLVQQAQAGSRAARDAVILRFLPWIRVQSRLYAKRCGRHDLIEDMQQAAVCGEDARLGGIMRAIELYNSDKGAPFDTYAIYWVNKALLGYINAHTNEHVSSRQAELNMRARTVAGDLASFLGREATVAEVRAAWGPQGAELSDKYIAAALADRGCSGPKPHAYFAATHAFLRRATVDEGAQAEYATDLHKLLQELTPRVQLVLALQYGEGMSSDEIANKLGVSASHVRKTVSLAISKMRMIADAA